MIKQAIIILLALIAFASCMEGAKKFNNRLSTDCQKMEMNRTHIDLFSGIGGFALAARWCGYETVVFCEKDKWCQRILAKNFEAVVADTEELYGDVSGEHSEQGKRQVPEPRITSSATIIPDIFDFDGTRYTGATLLTGGFPCQPFSVAGKRRGKEDDRHLWPEMCRVISEARPTWVIGENVAGFIPMELDNCLSDLEGLQYETQAFVISACAVDAPHRRDRVWIVAHSKSTGQSCCIDGQGQEQSWRSDTSGGGCCNWFPEPNVGRVAHGVSRRVDRLKGLGNAIVPQVAYEIIRSITKLV